MDLRSSLIERILKVNPEQFDELALDIGRFQYNNNLLYHQYCDLLKKSPLEAHVISDIPFLPIQFFKHTFVRSNAQKPVIVFESSTTTGNIPSRHGLWDAALYKSVTRYGFHQVMQHPVKDVTWLALLPSYLERPNASLVAMMLDFVELGGEGSGFFLHDLDALATALEQTEKEHKPAILLGVSFALLEFAERFPMPLRYTRIIETGGMKGRREEMTRQLLHKRLRTAFDLKNIGSEYGMTELLSQAWSVGQGIFQCAPTLRILIREVNDPMQPTVSGQRGAINCIDLANIDSCSFIATDDIGLVKEDGSIYILGRLDGSEQRGCNLMISDALIG